MITLNMNGLKSQKRRIIRLDFKNSSLCCLQEVHFRLKYKYKLKEKLLQKQKINKKELETVYYHTKQNLN